MCCHSTECSLCRIGNQRGWWTSAAASATIAAAGCGCGGKSWWEVCGCPLAPRPLAGTDAADLCDERTRAHSLWSRGFRWLGLMEHALRTEDEDGVDEPHVDINRFTNMCVSVCTQTTECCSVRGVPIVLAHGTKDGTNPIHRVREDVGLGTKGLVLLHEYEDDHGLAVIESGNTLLELLEEAYVLQSKVTYPGHHLGLENNLTLGPGE